MLKQLPFPVPSSVGSDVKYRFLNLTVQQRSSQTVTLKQEVSKNLFKKFNVDMIRKHSWLMMGNEGGFCLHCKLFCTHTNKPKSAGSFTAKPYTCYSKSKLCQIHEESQYHQAATKASVAFIALLEGKRTSISQLVQGKSSKHGKQNRARLHSIVKTIIHCSRQNIALRGHRNETFDVVSQPLCAAINGKEVMLGDVNSGNFRQSIRFRIDAGDKNLSSEAANKKSLYLHSSNQNELLEITADQITNTIIGQCTGPFTIIADETTDISNLTQLCIAIRYLHEGRIKENFVKLVAVESTKGNSSIVAKLELTVLLSSVIYYFVCCACPNFNQFVHSFVEPSNVAKHVSCNQGFEASDLMHQNWS